MLILRLSSALIVILVLSGCTGAFFHPMQVHRYSPADLSLEYRDIFVLSDNETKLHGWLIPATTARKGNLLFMHGNAENISTHFATVAWLTSRGYDVYVFDYRGYGKSQGQVQIDGIMRDASAMIDYVAEHSSDNKQLIVMGHSLGAAVAIYASAHSRYKQRIDAVVSIAAFSDYRAITRDVLARSWLTWILQWPLSLTIDNSYSPEKAVLALAPTPLLIMHSPADRTVGIHHARQIFSVAQQPKQFIEISGSHNQAFADPQNRELLVTYLEGL